MSQIQYEHNSICQRAKEEQAQVRAELDRMTSVVQHFMASIQNYLALQQQ
jgi:hypothetical protein